MKRRHFMLTAMILTVAILSFSFLASVTATLPYDPWYDINDDGKIDIKDVAGAAARFGTSGDPLTKAYLAYDSGWIDIANKAGQYLNITHNLNSTDTITDITGRTIADGGIHQRHFGLTGYTPGWSKAYGGTSHDEANSLIQTSDGGLAMAGTTFSFGAGGGDFWLVKTDAGGNEQWNKTYGVTGGFEYEWAACVVQSSDGGYAIAGATFSGGGDFWLVKADVSGTMQWNQTYGGIRRDRATCVVQTTDGGYAIAGYTSRVAPEDDDFYLVKTDSKGNEQWSRTYGGTGIGYIDEAFSVVHTSDGGYAIAGLTSSYGAGSADFWLVKTGASGDEQWSKTYGGTNSEQAECVIQTSDGGYAIAGPTGSYGAGAWDFWLVKTDAGGNEQWNKTYGGINNDYARSIVQTTDGGYAIAGYTDFPTLFNPDFWLIKTDIESGLAWTDSTAETITLYRGASDHYWNYVRVRIWKIKETP